jgi:hypothetical protein
LGPELSLSQLTLVTTPDDFLPKLMLTRETSATLGQGQIVLRYYW